LPCPFFGQNAHSLNTPLHKSQSPARIPLDKSRKTVQFPADPGVMDLTPDLK
jgi:hypothetical protein